MMPKILKATASKTGRRRKATATVELAVCLPLIVLLVFGGIEAANGIFLKQGLTAAAYETAKVATTMGYTSADALARGNQVLTARGFQNAVLDIQPPVSTTPASGTPVVVTATAPTSDNAVSPLVLYGGGNTVVARITMIRN